MNNNEDKYYRLKERKSLDVFRIFFYTAVAIMAILAVFIQFIYPSLNMQP